MFADQPARINLVHDASLLLLLGSVVAKCIIIDVVRGPLNDQTVADQAEAFQRGNDPDPGMIGRINYSVRSPGMAKESANAAGISDRDACFATQLRAKCRRVDADIYLPDVIAQRDELAHALVSACRCRAGCARRAPLATPQYDDTQFSRRSVNGGRGGVSCLAGLT